MRQKLGRRDSRRGDTLIEVMLSISIFAMVSLLTINMMNDGINTAQRTLEAEMARNEIDGQAEALRYIHNNYVAERNMDSSQFRKAWQTIIKRAMKPSGLSDEPNNNVYFNINNMESCETPYGSDRHLAKYNAFVINPRLLIPNNFGNTSEDRIASNFDKNVKYMGIDYDDLLSHMLVYYDDKSKLFSAPSLYPRIIYKSLNPEENAVDPETRALYDENKIFNDIVRAEGLWINASGNNENDVKHSDYYDFYVRTCWQSAGTSVPSTITTVVRLYNPEVME